MSLLLTVEMTLKNIVLPQDLDENAIKEVRAKEEKKEGKSNYVF